jgi:hypothetical protein
MDEPKYKLRLTRQIKLVEYCRGCEVSSVVLTYSLGYIEEFYV